MHLSTASCNYLLKWLLSQWKCPSAVVAPLNRSRSACCVTMLGNAAYVTTSDVRAVTRLRSGVWSEARAAAPHLVLCSDSNWAANMTPESQHLPVLCSGRGGWIVRFIIIFLWNSSSLQKESSLRQCFWIPTGCCRCFRRLVSCSAPLSCASPARSAAQRCPASLDAEAGGSC